MPQKGEMRNKREEKQRMKEDRKWKKRMRKMNEELKDIK